MTRAFNSQEVKQIFYMAAEHYQQELRRYTETLAFYESLPESHEVVIGIAGRTNRQTEMGHLRKIINKLDTGKEKTR